MNLLVAAAFATVCIILIHSTKKRRELSTTSAAPEKHVARSILEDLVPEIKTEIFRYLDCDTLCSLSGTSSVMRTAVFDDDIAWKSLYEKDFMEVDAAPPLGNWKAQYAAMRGLSNANVKFFNIMKEKSLTSMSKLWMNADYVTCIPCPTEYFAGYDDVMLCWEMTFDCPYAYEFDIREINLQVRKDVGWVTMRAVTGRGRWEHYISNMFEYRNGRWLMVLHHSSARRNS